MTKALKILLIIWGFGVFVLPKQLVYAQKTEQCCEQKLAKEDCCKKEDQPCHQEKSKKDSEKNKCENECTKCHTCSVNMFLNYISPEIYTSSRKHIFTPKLVFNHEISFFSSTIQNIWQPPKLG